MNARDIEIAKTLLKRPVAFHWALARVCESVNAGLMLSQSIYWSERTDDPEGWFYKTRVDWFNELCIGKDKQITAREILRELGFIKEKLEGNPPKLYFQVQFANVYKAVAQLSAKQTIKGRKNRQLENPTIGVGKTDNQPSGNQTILPSGNQTNIEEQRLPETTSDTTTEITGSAAGAAIPASCLLNQPNDFPGLFLELWNSTCGSLPKVREITKGRERKIKARLKAKPDFAQDFTAAVQHAAGNAFLTGDNNRGWIAGFDWMIQNDTNHVAVLEGKYDAKPQANSGKPNSERQGTTNGSGAKRNSGAYQRSETSGESAARFADRKPDLVF
jgi:hypothetical protein